MNDVEASRALVLSCMHVVFREAGGQAGSRTGAWGSPPRRFTPRSTRPVISLLEVDHEHTLVRRHALPFFAPSIVRDATG
jgi:hypothetical protein